MIGNKKLVTLLLFLCSIGTKVISQKATYEVFAIRFASAGNAFSVKDFTESGPATDSLKLDFFIWLIKGDNGRNILLDAGFIDDIEEAKEFNISNYQRPDSALQKLGIKASDITDVILSHPHWDHADGVDLFPNATVWMQKEDFNYFVSTAWQKEGDHGGFNKRDVRKLVDLNLAGKLTLVDGDAKEIIPGITAYTGSRHTYNSQYIQVKTGTNNIILASDNIWIYYSLEHMMPPSKGGTLDPAGFVKAMQRMKTFSSGDKFIIPGHDAKIFQLFPAVTDGVVQIK